MTNTIIEEFATNTIKNQILRNNDCLRAFVNENDKTPLWDGNIYIYNNSNQKNEDYEGKIDVQIKGRNVKKYNEKNTYPIEISTLKGYQKEVKGTLLFIVDFITFDNYKIYYCNLLPVDIYDILKNVKDTQQTVSLKLKEITNEGALTFKYVCLNFFRNSNLQAGKEIIEEKDFDKIETLKAIVIANEENISDNFVNGDIYTYAKLKDSDKEYIMVKAMKWTPFKELRKEISINGKTYYSTYTIYGNDNDIEEIHIDQMIINLKEHKINFNVKGTIDKRIKVLDFIINLLEYRYIMFDDLKIEVPFNEEAKILEYKDLYIKQFEYLKLVKKVLDMFNLKINIPYEEIKEADANKINTLVNLYCGEIADNVKNLQRYHITICGNKLIFVVLKNKKTIINFYSEDVLNNIECTCNNNGVPLKTSIFCSINEDDIRNVSNLNEKIILKSFKDIELEDITLNAINNISLNFLKIYDETLNRRYLSIADKISQFVMKVRGNDIDLINSKQIKFRKRNLSTNDKKLLRDISQKDIYKEEYIVLASISILLENKFDFEENFRQMKPKEKQNFKKSPIYNLYSKFDKNKY